MDVVLSADQERHAPQWWVVRGRRQTCPERPERAESLAVAARAAGYRLIAADAAGPAPRQAVHDPRYLEFLESAHRRWQAQADAGPEVVPSIHPGRHFDAYPASIVGQAGWHMADTSCPIGPDTWQAACAAADAAVHATELVLRGAPSAYALCRPPGHHAFADRAGGFCYLNNSAIAAALAATRTGGRVAVLDVDVHHGNGTQSIFYDRSDVLTVSLHCATDDFYPFFAGHADETGEAAGTGFNLNLPLARGTGDAAYLAVLDQALARIRGFDPAVLVVALGLDAFVGDPFAALAVTTPGFGEIARQIAALDRPTVLIQEGGYPCVELGMNLVSFLRGFEQGQAGR